MDGVVVIGGGIAGQAVCEALRERDSELPITLVCGEPRLPYDRVILSSLLVSGEDPESLQLRPAEWYEEHAIELRLGRRAEWIDPVGGACGLAGGETLRFGAAALATGSDPLLPPLPGIELEGVHAFRGPEDCLAIRRAAEGSTRAAVIGGGLLGLEAAYGIASRGCPVTVVHLMDRLMERQLDAGAAALLGPAMEALGADVLLERQTERVLGERRARGLRFTGGEQLDCDFVVVSIGIRARTDLARAGGIACERGVLVDDRMRSSAPNVVAVGECAEHRGLVYGIVAPIYEQAAVAADTLLGREGPGY
ncbi:MAG: NAD(P)/FAD-dependent oxidoreductase, partial [Thermoleophilaceae bacterium]